MVNCIVVVQFDLPKRLEEQAIKRTAPIYRNQAANGLIRKAYINGETGTGGVYLWKTVNPPRLGSPKSGSANWPSALASGPGSPGMTRM